MKTPTISIEASLEPYHLIRLSEASEVCFTRFHAEKKVLMDEIPPGLDKEAIIQKIESLLQGTDNVKENV